MMTRKEVCTMQVITFMAFKGGAGKTTSLSLLASVLNSRGVRIGLVDADENKSIHKWRDYSLKLGTWDDEKIKVYEGWDEERLETAFAQAANDDLAYVLVDTHGGGSELNQLAVLNSNLIVIPTDLSVGELDIALETMEYILNLQEVAETDIPTGLLLNRTPTDDSKFAVAEKQGMLVLKELPVFERRIPFNRLYKDMDANGPLNHYARYLQDDPATRFRAFHAKQALKQAEPMVDELLAGLQVQEDA